MRVRTTEGKTQRRPTLRVFFFPLPHAFFPPSSPLQTAQPPCGPPCCCCWPPLPASRQPPPPPPTAALCSSRASRSTRCPPSWGGPPPSRWRSSTRGRREFLCVFVGWVGGWRGRVRRAGVQRASGLNGARARDRGSAGLRGGEAPAKYARPSPTQPRPVPAVKHGDRCDRRRARWWRQLARVKGKAGLAFSFRGGARMGESPGARPQSAPRAGRVPPGRSGTVHTRSSEADGGRDPARGAAPRPPPPPPPVRRPTSCRPSRFFPTAPPSTSRSTTPTRPPTFSRRRGP